MWKAVQDIQSDAFFNSEDQKLNSAYDNIEQDKAFESRDNMKQLGNKLVEITDNLIKK